MSGQDTSVFQIRLDMDFDSAYHKTTALLAEEGFSILFEVNVQNILMKQGYAHGKYCVIGVFSTSLLPFFLKIDPTAGLVLPYHVVIAQADRCATVTLSNPYTVKCIADYPGLDVMIKDIHDRIERVSNALRKWEPPITWEQHKSNGVNQELFV